MALSEVARGKIMVAAKEGRAIPEGWALDAEGRPTTDPNAALSGAMLAMGGAKGALLAMVVELLCCALTGAAFGFEADSFFDDEGNRPRLGQALLVVDPGALAGAGAFAERIETLVAAMDRGRRRAPARQPARRARGEGRRKMAWTCRTRWWTNLNVWPAPNGDRPRRRRYANVSGARRYRPLAVC